VPVTGITSDGHLNLPVAGVHITSDRLLKITVTGIQQIAATVRFRWPVTSILHHGHSILLYISLKYELI
jgi:hypothetical protein